VQPSSRHRFPWPEPPNAFEDAPEEPPWHGHLGHLVNHVPGVRGPFGPLQEEFGSQCIVVAIDAKRNQKSGWEVYTYGGRKPAGLDAIEWARRAETLGAGEILLTSMDRDGTKEGYDIELTRTISENVPVPVIASGGAGKLEHLYHVLNEGKADAVLAASIFHFGTYTVSDVKKYLEKHNVPVRF